MKLTKQTKARIKAPRRDCHDAKKWMSYYQRQADWNQNCANSLMNLYPDAAAFCQQDADRFQSGVDEIKNRTHPNIISGKWKL